MVTTITGKNQVTVPVEIAKRAGIRVGSRLEWRTTSREGILEVEVLPDLRTVAARLRGQGNGARRTPGSAVERLVAERIQEDGAETQP